MQPYLTSASSFMSDEKTFSSNDSKLVKVVAVNIVDIGSSTTSSVRSTESEWNAGSIKCLLGAIVVEWMTWGFPLSYGILQRYYLSSDSEYHNETTYLTMIGTIAIGAPYCLGILSVLPLTRWPQYRRSMVMTGCFICAISLLASSFGTKLWHLLLTQGIGYAAGFICLYNPLLSMLNEWYSEKRGIAYGILSSVAGTSGLTIPYILDIGLRRYGHAITLQASALLFTIVLGPSMLLIQPKPSQVSAPTMVEHESVCTISLSVDGLEVQEVKSSPSLGRITRMPKFIIFTWSNVFQGIFNLMPALWIPTYAVALGLTTEQGTLLLVILNIASTISQFLTGWISDRALAIPIATSSLVSAIAAFALWYPSSTNTDLGFNILLGFVILYGLSAGGYSVFYGRFIMELSDDKDKAMWLWSFFEFERGIGIVIGGPISGMMVDNVMEGSSYGLVILLTGVFMAISSLSIIGWVFVRKEKSSLPGSV